MMDKQTGGDALVSSSTEELLSHVKLEPETSDSSSSDSSSEDNESGSNNVDDAVAKIEEGKIDGFVQESHLDEILKLADKEGTKIVAYRCKFCGYRVKKLDTLRRHEAAHVEGRFFQCSFCEFSHPSQLRVVEHQTRHTGEKPFKCDLCPHRTRYKVDLTKHERVHSSEKRYSCHLCSFRTKLKGNLSKHLQCRHSDDRPFPCPLCEMSFKNRYRLTQHIKIHSTVKPYSCDICGFKARTNYEIKSHKLSHSDVRKFVCTFPGCQQRCKTKSDLNKHSCVHVIPRNYRCDLCQKCFKTKPGLRTHVLGHLEKGQPHPCKVCHKILYSRTGYKNHMYHHQSNRRYMCSVCGHIFLSSSNMKKHMIVHTSGREYKCPICIFGSKLKDHLITHIGHEHSKDYTYYCEECLKPFGRYLGLRLHIERCHQDPTCELKHTNFVYNPDCHAHLPYTDLKTEEAADDSADMKFGAVTDSAESNCPRILHESAFLQVKNSAEITHSNILNGDNFAVKDLHDHGLSTPDISRRENNGLKVSEILLSQNTHDSELTKRHFEAKDDLSTNSISSYPISSSGQDNPTIVTYSQHKGIDHIVESNVSKCSTDCTLRTLYEEGSDARANTTCSKIVTDQAVGSAEKNFTTLSHPHHQNRCHLDILETGNLPQAQKDLGVAEISSGAGTNSDTVNMKVNGLSKDLDFQSQLSKEPSASLDANIGNGAGDGDGPHMTMMRSPPPLIKLGTYGGVGICLASKDSGMEFNFVKKGRKPKKWFMEPSRMPKKAAAKMQKYLDRKDILSIYSLPSSTFKGKRSRLPSSALKGKQFRVRGKNRQNIQAISVSGKEKKRAGRKKRSGGDGESKPTCRGENTKDSMSSRKYRARGNCHARSFGRAKIMSPSLGEKSSVKNADKGMAIPCSSPYQEPSPRGRQKNLSARRGRKKQLGKIKKKPIVDLSGLWKKKHVLPSVELNNDGVEGMVPVSKDAERNFDWEVHGSSYVHVLDASGKSTKDGRLDISEVELCRPKIVIKRLAEEGNYCNLNQNIETTKTSRKNIDKLAVATQRSSPADALKVDSISQNRPGTQTGVQWELLRIPDCGPSSSSTRRATTITTVAHDGQKAGKDSHHFAQLSELNQEQSEVPVPDKFFSLGSNAGDSEISSVEVASIFTKSSDNITEKTIVAKPKTFSLSEESSPPLSSFNHSHTKRKISEEEKCSNSSITSVRDESLCDRSPADSGTGNSEKKSSTVTSKHTSNGDHTFMKLKPRPVTVITLEEFENEYRKKQKVIGRLIGDISTAATDRPGNLIMKKTRESRSGSKQGKRAKKNCPKGAHISSQEMNSWKPKRGKKDSGLLRPESDLSPVSSGDVQMSDSCEGRWGLSKLEDSTVFPQLVTKRKLAMRKLKGPNSTSRKGIQVERKGKSELQSSSVCFTTNLSHERVLQKQTKSKNRNQSKGPCPLFLHRTDSDSQRASEVHHYEEHTLSSALPVTHRSKTSRVKGSTQFTQREIEEPKENGKSGLFTPSVIVHNIHPSDQRGLLHLTQCLSEERNNRLQVDLRLRAEQESREWWENFAESLTTRGCSLTEDWCIVRADSIGDSLAKEHPPFPSESPLVIKSEVWVPTSISSNLSENQMDNGYVGVDQMDAMVIGVQPGELQLQTIASDGDCEKAPLCHGNQLHLQNLSGTSPVSYPQTIDIQIKPLTSEKYPCESLHGPWNSINEVRILNSVCKLPDEQPSQYAEDHSSQAVSEGNGQEGCSTGLFKVLNVGIQHNDPTIKYEPPSMVSCSDHGLTNLEGCDAGDESGLVSLIEVTKSENVADSVSLQPELRSENLDGAESQAAGNSVCGGDDECHSLKHTVPSSTCSVEVGSEVNGRGTGIGTNSIKRGVQTGSPDNVHVPKRMYNIEMTKLADGLLEVGYHITQRGEIVKLRSKYAKKKGYGGNVRKSSLLEDKNRGSGKNLSKHSKAKVKNPKSSLGKQKALHLFKGKVGEVSKNSKQAATIREHTIHGFPTRKPRSKPIITRESSSKPMAGSPHHCKPNKLPQYAAAGLALLNSEKCNASYHYRNLSQEHQSTGTSCSEVLPDGFRITDDGCIAKKSKLAVRKRKPFLAEDNFNKGKRHQRAQTSRCRIMNGPDEECDQVASRFCQSISSPPKRQKGANQWLCKVVNKKMSQTFPNLSKSRGGKCKKDKFATCTNTFIDTGEEIYVRGVNAVDMLNACREETVPKVDRDVTANSALLYASSQHNHNQDDGQSSYNKLKNMTRVRKLPGTVLVEFPFEEASMSQQRKIIDSKKRDITSNIYSVEELESSCDEYVSQHTDVSPYEERNSPLGDEGAMIIQLDEDGRLSDLEEEEEEEEPYEEIIQLKEDDKMEETGVTLEFEENAGRTLEFEGYQRASQSAGLGRAMELCENEIILGLEGDGNTMNLEDNEDVLELEEEGRILELDEEEGRILELDEEEGRIIELEEEGRIY